MQSTQTWPSCHGVTACQYSNDFRHFQMGDEGLSGALVYEYEDLRGGNTAARSHCWVVVLLAFSLRKLDHMATITVRRYYIECTSSRNISLMRPRLPSRNRWESLQAWEGQQAFDLLNACLADVFGSTTESTDTTNMVLTTLLFAEN